MCVKCYNAGQVLSATVTYFNGDFIENLGKFIFFGKMVIHQFKEAFRVISAQVSAKRGIDPNAILISVAR